MENEVKQGKIDDDVLDTMLKEQIELGTKNAQQVARVELNFCCELLSQFREMNKNLENLYQTLNMVGAEKLTSYFKEFTANVKHEEQVQEVERMIKKSHKSAKSKKVAK